MVRRLVRSGTLTDDVLLDPWGGTIQFVRSGAAPVPFLSVARGFELRAPGPDGIVGTADDVRDPFERVLRSKTPYAEAVQEDRLVDARWDMVVSEETVQAWQQVLEELTGTALGSGGLGLGGVGSGGGGRGEGIGLGGMGTIGHGSGRGSFGISTGDAFWTAPVRTDAEGRVKLTIPLGDVETTWRLALIAVPDGLEPASTTMDIASEAPVSGRVDAGARWVRGDVVETNVTVRNRTAKPVRATVTASAEGAAALDAHAPPSIVDVPANGARRVKVRVTAKRAGEGVLVVTTRAPGVPDDVLRHTWEIAPPGERRVLTQTAWVEGHRELGIALDHGYAVIGAPRVVLERGYDDAVLAALDSLEPEAQTSAAGLADALEAAIRVERWATERSTTRHRAIARIAKGMGERAHGRFEAYAELDAAARAPDVPAPFTLPARVRALTKQASRAPAAPPKDASALCPPATEDALDAEPAPSPDVLPCWGAYVSNTSRSLDSSEDAAAVARAVLALAERPHRATTTAHLAEHLRRITKLSSTADIDAPGTGDRATRVLVYAALLRAHALGKSPASEHLLFEKIARLRDATGGYGSSAATLAVVRALLASQLAGHGATRARVVVEGSGPERVDQKIDVPADGFVSVALPAGALAVAIETDGPGLIARLERPVLRAWTRPPPPQRSPVSVEVVWPAEARAGSTDVLRVLLRQEGDLRGEVDVRIPLPPGVTLAAPTKGAAQLQGVLAIRQVVGTSGTVLEAPVRFGLAGKVTVPEAFARMTRRSSAPATAPARSLVVR